MTRERLLEAVRELLRERPWSAVTMAEVGRAAGVSRQTVYNEFGSRHDLAQAYVLWEAERFHAVTAEAVRRHPDDPVRSLTAAFDAFLHAAREHPLIRAIAVGGGGEELLALVTTEGAPLHEQATEALTGLLLDTFASVDRADARELADAAVRLGISHATLPGATVPDLGRLLGPYVLNTVR